LASHSCFAGKQSRLLQAHIDFLLMTALILGFYAAKVPLHWTIRWSMVIGAFYEFELVSAGGHISSAGFAHTRGRAVPDGLPALSDEQPFTNNLWVWRGGDYRPLVNISQRVLPHCHREVKFRVSDNLRRAALSVA
jgi:hypothetical protein